MKYLFLVIVFFTSLYIFAHFFGPIPFFIQSIQTTKTNLFQVQGTGKVSALPDKALVSFGVTKTANTVTDAQNQTNMVITNILNNIKSLGIDTKDITTTNYSVYPQYNYNNGSQTPTGYSVTQNIEVKLAPIEKASKAIDLATANGANVLGAVTFTLDDTTQKDLENKARKQAVDDAKAKAQTLASAAGMHLGRIVDIQEDTNPQPFPIKAAEPLVVDNAAKQTSQPTDLPAGQSAIVISVTLSYETY